MSIKENKDDKTVKIHMFMVLKRRNKLSLVPLEVVKVPGSLFYTQKMKVKNKAFLH